MHMEEAAVSVEQREDHSTNTRFPTGIFMCPSSMLKDQPLENPALLKA